jgi:hypothetical protein
VIDESFRPVVDVDDWLLTLRVGRGMAEGTTEAYATSLALFLRWCRLLGQEWPEAVWQFGRFVLWLRYYDPSAGPGSARLVVREARRVNAVCAAVREFVVHSAAVGSADRAMLNVLYEVVDDTDLPVEVRGEPSRRRT